jgi:cytochrome c oxidase assembly protein subunit 15
MVLGAYVKAIGAGMACPEWPSCEGGQFVPGLADPLVAAELAHRTAASLVALCGAALLVLLVVRYRHERALVVLTLAAASTLAVQIGLGAVTISSTLHPLVVTAHLAVATLFFALTLLIAVRCWRLPARAAPASAPTVAPADPEPQNRQPGGSAQ